MSDVSRFADWSGQRKALVQAVVVGIVPWFFGLVVWSGESALMAGGTDWNTISLYVGETLFLQPIIMVVALLLGQRYMVARGVTMTREGFAGMSVLLGLASWVFSAVVGLDLSLVWIGTAAYVATAYFVFVYVVAVLMSPRRL